MSKMRTVHRCKACGGTAPRWSGRCPACGEWNSLQEELVVTGQPKAGTAEGPVPIALGEVDLSSYKPMPTGIGELDRVLAGGLLPGSATLLGGEPGTGKSTLLLQVLASMASSGRRCLLVAAEEAAHQVRRRAGRLGAEVPGVFVVEATKLPAIEQVVANLAPDVVVVDSIQAISDPEIGSPAGSLAQVAACANSLVALAKGVGNALVLVGHVTKDGALAGPRALEHLVDTVLSFEGDRYLSLRAVRAVKHRFGPTGETGLFEMGEAGLTGVPDPSSLFLGDRLEGAPGSAVTVPMEGYRPLLVEVQALVGRSSPVPRRFVTGLDPGRVGFLVAVLDKRAGVPVGDCDVYVSVTGGARACRTCRRPCRMPGPRLVGLGEAGRPGHGRDRRGWPRRRGAPGERHGQEVGRGWTHWVSTARSCPRLPRTGLTSSKAGRHHACCRVRCRPLRWPRLCR